MHLFQFEVDFTVIILSSALVWCIAMSSLPLLAVSMQRKQSLAQINPIESDSFH